MQDRPDRMPEAVGVATTDPSNTRLRAWMGTLDRVRTRMSLRILASNLKRMIPIFGAGPLIAPLGPDRLAQATDVDQ